MLWRAHDMLYARSDANSGKRGVFKSSSVPLLPPRRDAAPPPVLCPELPPHHMPRVAMQVRESLLDLVDVWTSCIPWLPHWHRLREDLSARLAKGSLPSFHVGFVNTWGCARRERFAARHMLRLLTVSCILFVRRIVGAVIS